MFSSLTETFMAPASSKDAATAGKAAGRTASNRPSPLRSNRAASKTDAKKSASASSSRQPSSALDGPSPSEPTTDKETQSGNGKDKFDTFGDAAGSDDNSPEPPRASVDMDELPIELIGLADSFIESLQAKVHPTPPNIDSLSQKFQDFYATASTHIATHIAALAMRQNRERSPPPPPISARSSAASILRAKAASIGSKDKSSTPPPPPPKNESEQRMLSSEEIAERKRARRVLEQKRGLMEEAAERRLCEGIYDRIYRHRTTQDEAQDEKLRSKTAALDLVGISPADLGVDLGVATPASPEAVATRLKEVREWLEPARQQLVQMGQTLYPLGKLNRLKAAHKSIVDTLAHFHPSSSADEIMPMLIYTLITLPPEQLNVVSDLNFIQRFRWEQKMEGEAAYCLTNLEASISFLETVDLSTLRADEAQSGPVKAPGAETPKTETFPPAYFAQQGLTVPVPTAATPSAPEISTPEATATGMNMKSTPSPSAGLIAAVQLRNRRLSDLVNTPAHALSTASDAVMNTFNAADQGLKTIGNSLEGSYRLLFGRLGQPQQQQVSGPTADGAATADVVLPKTLDDARKLVTTPPPVSEDEASIDGDDKQQQQQGKTPQTTPPPPRKVYRRISSLNMSTIANTDKDGKDGKDDKMLTVLAGRKATSRDPSADSSRSSRKALADDDAPSTVAATNPALLDSVRSLGNSFNPMSRLSSIGNFRGFGRTASTSSTPLAVAAGEKSDGGDLATAFPDIAAALPPKPQIAPPVKRFMELHNPADLRISEVMELLRDYRRLATALKDLGAFEK
ncbi:vps9 domain protein [Sporothrix brasiliensis 5110]|uniref:Vps9 domain protein n=1 Tax=Sporothrix brasiliensis 5110 TaxID=1398154 RepID=A0A0C2FGM8_9PEZI|nr:vps9 domain protein [Sporothrix brasiliensis 5110]KIH90213.1 vps9 domain protein [Sporothrix brasiliensis 5110]